MGFATWPLRCLDCARRLAITPTMVFGTCVRCVGCQTLSFVIVFPALELAFSAEITAREWRDMAARGLSPRDVMREIGALRKVA